MLKMIQVASFWSAFSTTGRGNEALPISDDQAYVHEKWAEMELHVSDFYESGVDRKRKKLRFDRH